MKPRPIILIRRSLGGPGGAERVFARYKAALEGEHELITVSEKGRGFGPSWLKAMRFTRKADKVIQGRPEAISLSLERGPSADIIRAGDGVHKRYRLLAGPSLNLFHLVAPKLDQKSFEAAKIIIANSEMVKAEISQYYPNCAQKVRVVRNGIDTAKFSPVTSPKGKGELRHKLKLPETTVLYLFMGNGWSRKGLKQALEIARMKGAKLVAVGSGKGKKPFKNIIYTGVVDNMPDYYRACDAFVLPTLYDPATISVVEALACGLRVVTTRQNGAAELVKHGETGFIMDAQNKNLKEAADWLSKQPSLMPRQIAETVKDYTVEREIAALREIFREVEGKSKTEEYFTGVIVEESLKDPSILKKFEITATKIEPMAPGKNQPWLKQWTLHDIRVPASKAKTLAEEMRLLLIEKVLYKGSWHKDNWYADWKNSCHHYVIFPKKIFYIDRHRKEEYDEACAYGISLGIPPQQVDFRQDIVS